MLANHATVIERPISSFLSLRPGRDRASVPKRCGAPAFALVARDGWLASEPVQVEAVLAHDDDPCDVLLRSNLRFALAPLRGACRDV